MMSMPLVTAGIIGAYGNSYTSAAASSFRQDLERAYPDLDFGAGHLEAYWPALQTVHAQALDDMREATARRNFSSGFAAGALFAVAAFALLSARERRMGQESL